MDYEEFEVIWSESADEALRDIRRHISRDNPAAADKLIAGILRRVEVLRRSPLIGAVYKKDRTGRTREIVYKRYRIFYQVIKKARRVEILNVWHSARQEPDLGLGK